MAIRRFVLVENCGRTINPMIVGAQAIGGVAQCIGAALLEEVVYNEDGQLLTGTLMDYLVPTASEIPLVEVLHLARPSRMPSRMRWRRSASTSSSCR